MSKRLWLLGVGILVSIAVLVACGTNYNSSSDGLLLVGSQGSGLIETFSFTLDKGKISAIANSPSDTASQTCVLNGFPFSIVIDPTGTYAYTIIQKNSSCGSSSATGIQAFKVNSNGTLTTMGNLIPLSAGTITISGAAAPNNTEKVNVVPSTMVVDAAGKYLFIADRATTDSAQRFVPGGVSVLAIGSDGSLTEVAGSPFYATTPAATVSSASFDIVSVAATPTVFPKIGINGVQNAVCSVPGNSPPTSEFLLAVDSLGYQVFEFQVDTSSGALKVPTGLSAVPAFPTDQVPAGVAVDPCDRFVYVSDSLRNKVSAYTICTIVQSPGPCPNADGSLVEVSGSPYSLTGNAATPGPLVVDPYGNNLYVLDLDSNTVSPFKISPITGALTAMSPSVLATGIQPRGIAIRSDDNWMFVTNYGAATVSQYSITPATGALSAASPIQTDNYPWGVAVK